MSEVSLAAVLNQYFEIVFSICRLQLGKETRRTRTEHIPLNKLLATFTGQFYWLLLRNSMCATLYTH